MASSFAACDSAADNDENGNIENPETAIVETESQPIEIGASAATVSDFFPILPDVRWRYEGNDVTFAATNDVSFGYINGAKAQRRVSAGGMATTEIIDASEGKVEIIHGDNMYYYYDDITYAQKFMSIVILKEPLEMGAKWLTAEDAQSEITSVNAPVTVPAGEFSALEVTTTYSNGYVDKYYYAKGVGLVKSVCDSGAGRIVSELADVLKGEAAAETISAGFYWPNVTEGSVERIEKDLLFTTDANFPKQFSDAMKEPPSIDYTPLLTPNATINDITVDWTTKTAKIDISGDYLKEINVGDGLQTKILQCLTNTIGNFYGVDEVLITIDQKPYENGAAAFEPGETIPVEKEDQKLEEKE
jgi:hypothetical protein